MHVIHGTLKEYDWGPIDGLARWYGSRTGAYQAELWFGTHANGPSALAAEGATLDTVIDDAPILVKLLAADRPLSIQVHPTASVARTQWERQQTGAEVVYPDANEKAELLVALEPFDAFAGWRQPQQAIAMLQAIDGTAPAAAALGSGDVHAAIQVLLSLGEHPDVATMITRLPEAAAAAGLPEASRAAYRQVAHTFPNDRGALVTCLLADVHLVPGEALFVPAGVPHSYLHGLALEVMTSSDNVVRLGLTSKPVFVDHALDALITDAAPTRYPKTGDAMRTPPDFDVRFVQDDVTTVPSGRYRLVLCLDGSVQARIGAAATSAHPGQAVVVTADEADLTCDIAGFAAVVTSRTA